jgi:hypothetical protein
MASFWKASVLLGDSNKKETRLNLQIGLITGVDFAAEAAEAATRLGDYATDLGGISTAYIKDIRLTCVDPNGDIQAGYPGAGVADVSKELVLVCHTDDPDEEGEVDRLRVPSPVATVWINDQYEEGFDLADADAAAYVENFTDGFEFSDSEHVDDTEGTNGIKAGYWRSRKMQIKS